MANTKNLDKLLESFIENGLPGCGLQICKDGNTIYEGYSGYANIEKNIPVKADSLFRQATCKKCSLWLFEIRY